jgi:hypothetical protein
VQSICPGLSLDWFKHRSLSGYVTLKLARRHWLARQFHFFWPYEPERRGKPKWICIGQTHGYSLSWCGFFNYRHAIKSVKMTKTD